MASDCGIVIKLRTGDATTAALADVVSTDWFGLSTLVFNISVQVELFVRGKFPPRIEVYGFALSVRLG